MGYFNFYIIKKIINSLFRYIRKNKKFIIIFIIFVCILFIKEKCFAVTAEYDFEQELITQQMNNQNIFVYEFLPAYLNQNSFYTEELKPMLDNIGTSQDIYIRYLNFSNRTEFYVYTFNYTNRSSTTMKNRTSNLDNTNISIYTATFDPSQYKCYHIVWHRDTDTGTVNLLTNTNSYDIPYCLLTMKSPIFMDFMNLVITGSSSDMSLLLADISTDLNTLNSTSTDILSVLNNLSSSLSSIDSNTSTDYSNSINAIEDKIDDLNDNIQDVNNSVQEVNDSVQEVNDSVQDLKDTITDDTVESSAEDLPSTDVTDPTQSGIDSIFQSIYNAFCVGQAQDIVFPIPFTDKSITLSPYYVRDMLNNNNASWVYDIIQAFWGYLIGRFIIKDILNKITKIKSGNIEDIQNDNIKGDML